MSDLFSYVCGWAADDLEMVPYKCLKLQEEMAFSTLSVQWHVGLV